ncbi:MAG: FMN-binding protein [Halanaerobiales bacterium]
MQKIRNSNHLLLIIGCSILLVLTLAGCQPGSEEPGGKEEGRQDEQQTGGDLDDGEFIGYSDTTDRGYAWAKIVIENDNITDVELMEVTSRGNNKDYSTYEYEPSVEAYEEMPDRFREADSADVELYSEATNSSEKYQEAVERALSISAQEVENDYFNGTFQGTSTTVDTYGYGVALVTIDNDSIDEVELKEVTEDGEFRDYEEYEYEEVKEAREEMAERFVAENSADVDTYSGATSSSRKFIQAVENALLHASTSQGRSREREKDIEKEMDDEMEDSEENEENEDGEDTEDEND